MVAFGTTLQGNGVMLMRYLVRKFYITISLLWELFLVNFILLDWDFAVAKCIVFTCKYAIDNVIANLYIK